SQNLTMLKQKCPSHLLGILSKRFIYRITAQIVEREKAEAIVTGETIGERPHQTLRQFRLQDQAIRDYPIHRPLAGLTTVEIKKLAQKIGIQKALIIKPKNSEAVKPSENILPTLEEVEAAESRLSIQEMIDTTINQLESITT
ncbi:hypothetical protein KAI30_03655, partial [Candidatus Bathyarchaeota archaeon]|nr:hypothetical protein [Candidatus Bathyarchaeota archaeon]